MDLKSISEHDVMCAVRNDAPSHVVVNILRRWRGWRGLAKIGRCLERVLDDVDVLELGVFVWIPEEVSFEVKNDFVEFLSKTSEFSPVSIAVRNLPALTASDVPHNRYVTALKPSDMSKREKVWIEQLRCFPALKTLDLGHMPMSYTKLDDHVVGMFCSVVESGAIPHLEHLILARNYVQAEGMDTISQTIKSGALVSLQRLDLYANRIEAQGMAHLCRALESGALPNLLSLNVGLNRIKDEGMKHLGSALRTGALRQLRELGLALNNIGDEGTESLCGAVVESGALPCLQNLILDGNSSSVLLLCRALDRGAFSSLSSLSLGANYIDAEGIGRFSRCLESGALSSLQVLNIDRNTIGAEGARQLCRAFEAGTLSRLRYLMLSSTNLGTEGAHHLCRALEAGALPSLCTVIANDNTIEAFPNLQRVMKHRQVDIRI